MDCHILLVEDEMEVRRPITRVLEAKGATVTTAAGGADALEQMRTAEEVELILLDLMMPDMNGWDVREQQLDEGLVVDVPVVIFSGVNSDLSDEQAALGAADFLVKPIRPDELYETVATYCDDGG